MLHDLFPFIAGYSVAFAMLVAALAAEIIVEFVQSKRGE